MKVTIEQKFERWVLAPIKQLRALPNGDGAFAALTICCGLFERFIRSRLDKENVKATPEAFRKRAAKELGCTEDAVQRFWDGYRLGMQHAFQPKAYIEHGGAGDRWGWEMAETKDFHHDPEIVQQGAKHFVMRIDPWKFSFHVLRRWREQPELMNELSEFVLGEVAPVEVPNSSQTSFAEQFRTYYEGPPPPSVTGKQ